MKIKKQVYESLIRHAKEGYPNEACGLLAGTHEGDGDYFFPMTNMDKSSVSYFMDPKEQLDVFKAMRKSVIQMTGIYHSHVASEAYPSEKDMRLAFYPGVSYLIVSLSDMEKPNLRSYKIENGTVKEESLEID